MKRTERRHLKENPLARIIADIRDYVEPRSGQLRLVLGILVVLVLAVLLVTFVRQRSESQAAQLLAQAMVALNARVVPAGATGPDDLPAAAALGSTGTFTTEAAKLEAALPALEAAATTHPDTNAGITARYHLAGALAALGRNEDAIAAFNEVIERAGEESIYRRMARLGLADAQARAGQLDAAIESWKQLVAEAGEDLPADAILIELARAYVASGNVEEARKTFMQIVDEYPGSPYASAARNEMEGLQG